MGCLGRIECVFCTGFPSLYISALCLCLISLWGQTDDCGVFGSGLTQEYAHAQRAFALSDRQLFDLVRASPAYTFADTATQAALSDKFTVFAKQYLSV